MVITMCCLCVLSCVFTTLYRTEYLMHMFDIWHIYAHTASDMHIRSLAYMVYMPYLVGIFVFGTFLANICKVKVQLAVFGIYLQTCGVYMSI